MCNSAFRYFQIVRVNTCIFLETLPKKFTSEQYISYDLLKGNNSVNERLAHGIFVVGFKTTEENVALAQLDGMNDRHISLALADGYLTLFYSLKIKVRTLSGLVQDTETQVLRITQRKLNNNEHNVARVEISTEEIFLSVPNYDLKVGANATERFIDELNKNLGTKLDVFGIATAFRVGRIVNNGISASPYTLGTSFTGCMSGAKLELHPHANATMRFRKSVEIDMFKLPKPLPSDPDPNPTGVPPLDTIACGVPLPIPGKVYLKYKVKII